MTGPDLTDTLRGEINRLRADRDDLCADLAALQRQVDILCAEADEGLRLLEELREFEREYRTRLIGWMETGLNAIKGPEVTA